MELSQRLACEDIVRPFQCIPHRTLHSAPFSRFPSINTPHIYYMAYQEDSKNSHTNNEIKKNSLNSVWREVKLRKWWNAWAENWRHKCRERTGWKYYFEYGHISFQIYIGNSLVCGLGKCHIDLYYRIAHGLY